MSGAGGKVGDSGEIGALEYASRQLRSDEPVVVFDVGANSGDYGRTVAARFGERATIHCFEPSKAAFDRLSANLAGAKNVNLHNFGMSDSEGEATLYSDVPGSPLASVYDRRLDHFGTTMGSREVAHFTTLDNFCVDHGIRSINILKLDVEGHELRVLHGGQKLV